MFEYILILTLVGSTNQSGQSVHHIGGFAKQEECIDAGNRWLSQVRSANENRIAKALCVGRVRMGERNG